MKNTFNLHDDVLTKGTPELSDRILISAESVSGRPNRYITISQLFELLQNSENEIGTQSQNKQHCDTE